jgi:Fe-S-cluster-containing dehydrogenase component/formate-dependent nitrite reductase membrane component NrfD
VNRRSRGGTAAAGGNELLDTRSDAGAAEVTERWAKVIDHTRCIGCHACTTACKSENEVPLGVTRTYVKYVDVGLFPEARRNYQVTRCNQCDDAPCVAICPTQAMYRRPDGIVDFDKSACIGCKACMAACPYDAIFINPEDHSAEKCNFCAHRLDVGLEPACVTVCPTQAILVGDLNDAGSRVAQLVHREPVAVRRPEKDTQPKLFYLGASQATLDPLAARRPDGGLFMWSEQQSGADHVVSGAPRPASGTKRGAANSSAAALLSYDVAHTIPWDGGVSLYTLTKGVAAGAYLVACLAVLLGKLSPASPLWNWMAPFVSLVALALTGGILITDLEHPGRFWMLFARPHWRSWLVRGSWIIAGYGAVLTVHLVLGWSGRTDNLRVLALAGVPLGIATAVYTAWLFAQAKARDLWQSPLLPPHLLLQALVAGAAVLVPLAFRGGEETFGRWLLQALAGGAALHLAAVLGEVSLPHATAHGRLAVAEMTSGRYRSFFVGSWVLLLATVAGPWLLPGTIAPWAVSIAALVGLLAYEHSYVQAGQAVPLA